MGATIFDTVVHGETARIAFSAARSQAQYEHGHVGYTGTIAEKDNFEEFSVPANLTAREFANLLGGFSPDDAPNPKYSYEIHQALLATYPTYNDKWGPAVCLKIEEGLYLFCGWASC